MKDDFVIDENGTLTEYRGHEKKIILPDTIKIIGPKVFSGTHGYGAVEELTVGEGVLAIKDDAFQNSNLETIKLPSTLKVIGSAAFQGCKNLKSITIPEGVKKIWGKTFEHSGLEEIYLPKGLDYIDRDAFRCCYELKKVYLTGEKDIRIREDAFAGCLKLLDENGLAIVANKVVNFKPQNHQRGHLYLEIPDCVTAIVDNELFHVIPHQHLTMSLKCPSWPVEDSEFRGYSSTIIFQHGSSIAFKDNDGNIAAKVILAVKDEEYWTAQDCIFLIRPKSSGGFDFAAYDRSFSKLRCVGNKAIMALVRLGYPYECSDEMRKAYTEFLYENCAEIIKMIIDCEFADLDMDQAKIREVLEQIHAVNSDVIREVIGYFQQQGDNEKTAQLLEYQKKFREEDPFAKLKLSDDVKRDNRTDDGEQNE